MKKTSIRVVSLLISLFVTLSLLPTTTFAAEDQPTIVIAASDFQASGDHSNSAANVTAILKQIKADYPSADGFMFAGDHDRETINNETETKNGIAALLAAMQGQYSNINHDNAVIVQGNHDYPVDGLDPTGANDQPGYGVFVVREDDYTNGGAVSPNLFSDLKKYLDEKVASKYTKPIFVVSHVPLQYSSRTALQGDALHAKNFVELLNDAAYNGLTITFLYGHDHSHGYDSYLGGAAVYLTKGDTLWVADGVNKNNPPQPYTINFTYMNAGFTGYFIGAHPSVDDALTMTVFEIYDDHMITKRYDANGIHNLKSAGEWCAEYDESTYGYKPYRTTVASPQKTMLSKAENIGDRIYMTAKTDLTTAFSGFKTGDSVNVMLKSDVEENVEYTWSTSDKNVVSVYGLGTRAAVNAKGVGVATVTVDAVSTDGSVRPGSFSFEVAVSSPNAVTVPGEERTVWRLTDQVVTGETFLIVNDLDDGYIRAAVQNKSGSAAIIPFAVNVQMDDEGEFIETNDETLMWDCTIKHIKSDGTPYADLKNKSTGLYLQRNGAALTTTSDAAADYTYWRIGGSYEGLYTIVNPTNYNSRYYARYSDSGADFKIVTEANNFEELELWKQVKTTGPSVSVSIDETAGAVEKDSAADAETGAILLVVNSDGSHSVLPVTLEMLSGEGLDVTTVGTYSGLTVTYNGTVIAEDFELEVKIVDEDIDPDPGKDDPKITKGDLNKDTKVTVSDILLLKTIIMSGKTPTEEQLEIADISGDGKLTVSDILEIKAIIMG